MQRNYCNTALPERPVGPGGVAVEPDEQRGEKGRYNNLLARIIKRPARGVPIPIIARPPRAAHPPRRRRKKEAALFSELGSLRMVSHLCCRCQSRLEIALPSRPVGPGGGPGIHPADDRGTLCSR